MISSDTCNLINKAIFQLLKHQSWLILLVFLQYPVQSVILRQLHNHIIERAEPVSQL
jgi:hypothetical protein